MPSERRPTVWVSAQVALPELVVAGSQRGAVGADGHGEVFPAGHADHVRPAAHVALAEVIVSGGQDFAVRPEGDGMKLPGGDAALLGLGPGDGDGPLQRNAAQVTESCLVPQDSAAGRADFFYFGPAPIAEPCPRAQVHAAGSTLYHRYHRSYPNFAVRDQMAAAIRSPIWAVPTWVPCPAYRSGVR